MARNLVNFYCPGKILSILYVAGRYLAIVDFGAPIMVVLRPYQNEQIGEYIVMNDKGAFIKINGEEAVRQMAECKKTYSTDIWQIGR